MREQVRGWDFGGVVMHFNVEDCWEYAKSIARKEAKCSKKLKTRKPSRSQTSRLS